MPIKEPYLEIKMTNSNCISRYRKLGYKADKGEVVKVQIKDLGNSTRYVTRVCEICGKEDRVKCNNLISRCREIFGIKFKNVIEIEEKVGLLCKGCRHKQTTHRKKYGGEPTRDPERLNLIHEKLKVYRRNAQIREIDFNLTADEFHSLVPGECHYCGSPSEGIDRKDSSKGYTMENCLPCCSMCNNMKMGFDYETFFTQMKKILARHNK